LRGRFAECIELRPRHARLLVAYVVATALLGEAAVSCSALPLSWKCAISFLAGANLIAGLRRNLPRVPGAVDRATLVQGKTWSIRGPGGNSVAAVLTSAWGERYGPVLALEWICEDGVAWRAWITRWDVSPAEWRRLRVSLGME